MVPVAVALVTCRPKTRSGRGLSKAPSSSIRRAPPTSPFGRLSSTGWNSSATAPRHSARAAASTSAAAIRMATWQSCPQACITPTSSPPQRVRARLAKGRSTSSVTGRASMSARSATTGPGPAPQRVTPTTPVTATPSRTS